MGQLSKVTLTGNLNKIIEGEILLGRDSSGTKLHRKDREQRSTRFPNPFFFCAEGRSYENLIGHVGNYIVLEFKFPKPRALIQCSAVNGLVDLYPVHKKDDGEDSFIGKLPSIDFRRNTGVSIGRIVTAIQSGKHKVRWEITLQKGNAGNDFISLSIGDEGLFNFSVKCLRSAERVKVFYTERILNNVRVGDHREYVWKIEHIPDI